VEALWIALMLGMSLVVVLAAQRYEIAEVFLAANPLVCAVM
jgi:hypothetical protein